MNILTHRNDSFGKTMLKHSISNDEQKIKHNVIQWQRNLCDYLSEQTNYDLIDSSEYCGQWLDV